MKNSLPPPPQMGNGGSPPAHLPSSTAPDDFHFADFPCIAAKWMQPPARAPERHDAWMHEWNNEIWDILATPDDWLSCGMLNDLKFAATGAHPSWSRRDGPDEAAYQAWKRAVDDMWLSHATLDEHHALIETRARLELALARQIRKLRELSAARTIFLWLRQCRLHARLARQTSRRQVREAALARLRHEQECSDRAAEQELADDRLRVPPAEARPLAVAVRRNMAGACATAAPASPDRVPAAIRRIQAAHDTLAAPLDALLAEFAALAVNTAPPSKTSPVSVRLALGNGFRYLVTKPIWR